LVPVFRDLNISLPCADIEESFATHGSPS
jgi:hypothetical protein